MSERLLGLLSTERLASDMSAVTRVIATLTTDKHMQQCMYIAPIYESTCRTIVILNKRLLASNSCVQWRRQDVKAARSFPGH